MNHTPATPGAQHLRDVVDIWGDPVLFRTAIERVEQSRKRDPRARYLQTICLSDRRIVDSFWRAPIRLDLQGIAHEGDATVLVLFDLGRWFVPFITDDVLAGCILPVENIVRAAGAGRSLLDLQPLDAVANWLQWKARR